MKKYFLTGTAAVLLLAVLSFFAACSGAFTDPGAGAGGGTGTSTSGGIGGGGGGRIGEAVIRAGDGEVRAGVVPNQS